MLFYTFSLNYLRKQGLLSCTFCQAESCNSFGTFWKISTNFDRVIKVSVLQHSHKLTGARHSVETQSAYHRGQSCTSVHLHGYALSQTCADQLISCLSLVHTRPCTISVFFQFIMWFIICSLSLYETCFYANWINCVWLI